MYQPSLRNAARTQQLRQHNTSDFFPWNLQRWDVCPLWFLHPKQRAVCISNRRVLKQRKILEMHGLHYQTRHWRAEWIRAPHKKPGKLLQPKSLRLVRWSRKSQQENCYSLMLKSTSAARMRAWCRASASAAQPLCSWASCPDWSQCNPYNNDVFAWFVSE